MHKHGTNRYPTKWGYYAKELVRVRMALENELTEQIIFMSSALKTHQRTVLTKYATLQ